MEYQWSTFFDRIIRLLTESERGYGVANQQFTEYILEQLEFTEHSCRLIKMQVDSLPDIALQTFQDDLQDLLTCLQQIRYKWQGYQDSLDRDGSIISQIPATAHSAGRPGRPPFEITKEQIEYLLSLSFSLNEVASLIGVSRTTLYRYYYILHTFVIVFY